MSRSISFLIYYASIVAFPAVAQVRPASGDWPLYGRDPGGTRYSPLKQINTSNVSRLERVWTYHTGEKNGQQPTAFETTPLVIHNVLYLSTPSSRVIALNAETGEEIWKFDPVQKNPGPLRYRAHRGVAWWAGDANTQPRILYGTQDARLIALNATTGRPIPGFGDEGEILLRHGVADRYPDSAYAVTSPPAIFKDLVIVGSEVPESPGHGPSGDVRAFHVSDGKLAWQFHTVPRPGEPGNETWAGDSWKDRTGVNAWSMLTVDAQHGLVFVPLGSPAYDFYGGDRKGQNLYGNCVVALEASSGKVRWFYQLVHHDVWDYDPPAAPALITVNGRPAVAQVTKMGLVFLLDRLTGKPIFGVEERPVPQSEVPGEATWPTQPIPVKPPPISRSSMTRAEISQVTPESNRYCTELYDTLTTRGRYTPYGTALTLVFPGTLGGATWSGVSFDPERGYLFVNANEAGAIGRLEAQPEGSPVRYRRVSAMGEYARFWDQNMWPCQQPPWGTLSAIDVNKGEIAWKVPLGITEALGDRPTGAPNIGGSIATAGGLVFIGATNDSRFRAFDSRMGRELWTEKIEGSGHATPMTYLGAGGRQFVVIAAGGGGFFGSKPSDAVAAFALPLPARK